MQSTIKHQNFSQLPFSDVKAIRTLNPLRGKEVADAIFTLVDAKAVAVIIQAKHMCMMMRGVEKQSSVTKTEYLIGAENLTPDEKSRLWKQFER